MKPAEGVAAEARRQLVGMLSAQGMSTRAIAPTVGVSNFTVSKDRQVLDDLTPEPEHIDHETGEILRASIITGLDGKTYRRPEGHERPSETAARIIAEAKPGRHTVDVP